VGIVQLVAHEVGKCIICGEGGDALFSSDFGGTCLYIGNVIKIVDVNNNC